MSDTATATTSAIQVWTGLCRTGITSTILLLLVASLALCVLFVVWSTTYKKWLNKRREIKITQQVESWADEREGRRSLIQERLQKSNEDVKRTRIKEETETTRVKKSNL
jgi:hypothetical protein